LSSPVLGELDRGQLAAWHDARLVAKGQRQLLAESRELGAFLPFKPAEQSLLIGGVLGQSHVDQREPSRVNDTAVEPR
jgi:hypothetical protein